MSANASANGDFLRGVCAKPDLRRTVRQTGATWLAALIDPEAPPVLSRVIPRSQQLLLRCMDIEAAGRSGAPSEKQVSTLLAFGEKMPGTARLVVTCHAGISRSPAAALILLAQKLGPERLEEAGAILDVVRPQAEPNLLLCRLADEQLGLDGRLLELAEEICARGMTRRHALPIRRTCAKAAPGVPMP